MRVKKFLIKVECLGFSLKVSSTAVLKISSRAGLTSMSECPIITVVKIIIIPHLPQRVDKDNETIS